MAEVMPDRAFQDRMEQLIERVGGRTKLARDSGLSPGVIDKYRKGESDPSRERLVSLARAGNVSVQWLATGENIEGVDIDGDAVDIPFYVPGKKFLFVRSRVRLPKSHFIKATGGDKGDQFFAMTMAGDAMEPGIKDGDLVLIDKKRRNLEDGVFAIKIENSIIIRRLWVLMGWFEIAATNLERYPPEKLSKEEILQVEFLGRVIWVGRTLG